MSLTVDIEKILPGFHLRVSFQSNNTTLGILGSSGSGKSMTLRCIAGLETPTRGYIALDGSVLYDSQTGINLPPQKRKTGFVFQNYALFPHLTVAQNILLGLRITPRNQQNSRLDELLALVQMEHLQDRYPAQLSFGQQQRIALARALATDPQLLLLDEPLSALDNHLRGDIIQQLALVLNNYGKPAVFVTHHLDEAYRLCPQLLLLHNGSAVTHGTREELFARPPVYEAAKLTACQNISRARNTGTDEIEAVDWGCKLRVSGTIPKNLAYAGIRAHHIHFTDIPGVNTFTYTLQNIVAAPDYALASVCLANHGGQEADSHLKVKMDVCGSADDQKDLPPYLRLPADAVFCMGE